MKEKKEAVEFGKAWSNLFLTLNHERNTLQKTQRLNLKCLTVLNHFERLS